MTQTNEAAEMRSEICVLRKIAYAASDYMLAQDDSSAAIQLGGLTMCRQRLEVAWSEYTKFFHATYETAA